MCLVCTEVLGRKCWVQLQWLALCVCAVNQADGHVKVDVRNQLALL